MIEFIYRSPSQGHTEYKLQAKEYSNDLDMKFVFTTLKLRDLFSVKDCVPRVLRSPVIYKFTFA